jgi:hypothetical protein
MTAERRETTEDELDLAAAEFMKTFNAFKGAAKKLMAIIESMREKNYQELKDFSDESERMYEFLIQVKDDNGQILEKAFGIKCLADEEEKQK